MVTFTKRDHCAGPNRRNILQGAAGAALATVLPSLAAGAEPLHVRVAASVRDLAGRDPAPLTLMSPVRSGANLLPVLAKFTEMTGIDVILIDRCHTERGVHKRRPDRTSGNRASGKDQRRIDTETTDQW